MKLVSVVAATVLLFVGFAIFLVRNMMPHTRELPGRVEIMWFHSIVVVVLAVLACLSSLKVSAQRS